MRLRGHWKQFVAVAGTAIALYGCSPKEHDAVVATVGKDPITIREYEKQYLKNSPDRDSAATLSLAERQRFLDLMVNYHLKLEQAQDEHVEQQPAIRNEIEQYKGGLASSFITEREIVGPALRALYDRRSEEIRASHILIQLRPHSSPEDSAEAYKQANEIMARLKQGTPFDTLARQLSQDPSAKQNGGDLYYFTAGMMVPEFENAVYAMKTGEVGLIRTSYGVHIVKVTDRRPASGEIRASHIMVRFTSPTPSPEDTAAAYAKISAIKDSLAKGGDFAGLAKRNSGDPGSAPQGGDLGWFSRRRWVLPFDEAAFKLNKGQVSGIIRTAYGYHLIQCTDQRPRKTFEQAKPELQQIYQQLKFSEDYRNYLDRLKHSLGLVRNDDAVNELLARSDSNKTTRDSAWAGSLTPALGKRPVLSARGRTLTLDSVVSTITQRTDLPATTLRPAEFSRTLDKIEEQFAWTVAADSLAGVYPEFASILREYRDGVLLYQMEQEKVWNRVTPNDSVLALFYEKNKERFSWPERVEFTELAMANERTANIVANFLKSGKSIDEIVAEDSVRMAQPTQFIVRFARNGSTVTSSMSRTLAAAAAQVKRDTTTSISLIAYPDTGKAGGEQATHRVEALKTYLTKTLKVPASHIFTSSRPPMTKVQQRDSTLLAARGTRVDVMITGRQPLLVSKPQTLLLSAKEDPRAARADSLTPGSISAPFVQRGLHVIVRLNGREPARLKTFQEAQGEVSSLYQDSESKRLEEQWLKDLRAKYPVVVNTDALRTAFAPVAQ